MSSFPFTNLPIELQLLVWHHARASVGQVITGDLNCFTKTLIIRSHNIDRLKEYVKLLSICHISREEALRERPVFFFNSGIFSFSTRLGRSDPSFSWGTAGKRFLAIKQWPFGYAFAGIVIHIGDVGAFPPGAVPLAYRCDVVGKLLVHFFGGGIRRLHLHGRNVWQSAGGRETPISWRTDKPVHTTFCDANALRLLVPALGWNDVGLAELVEVVRQDVHGGTSQNVAQPITVGPDDRGNLVACETLVGVVRHMRAHFPDLEYVSLLSLNVPPSVDKTSADKTSADKSAVDNTAFNDTADDNTAVDSTA